MAFIACIALLRALRRRGFLPSRAEPDLRELLDLVALATVCDVMPLTGLNRALVTQGLKVMAKRARPGIAALLDVAKLNEAPTAMNCGFALGPRINAAGRIAEADMGLRLLLAEDADEAPALAETLDAVNRQRQDGGGRRSWQRRMAHGRGAGGGRACGDAAGAGRLASGRGRHRRRADEGEIQPAGLVAGIADGLAKGSGRSVPGLDLGAAVIAARQIGLADDRRRACHGGGVFAAAGRPAGVPCVPE